MSRVFVYELRRLFGAKTFAGALLISLFYAWQTLHTKVIRGIAHTAPFSPWSFGAYLAVLLPLLCALMYLLLWDVFSPAAQRLRPLTEASGVDMRRYYLLRFTAVGLVCFVFMLLLAAAGIAFVGSLFPICPADFIFPFLLCVVPSLIFLLGAGAFFGSLRPAFIFVLIPVMLAFGISPLPLWAQPFMSGFFESYPLMLTELDPAFSVPVSLLVCRIAYTLLGAFLLYAAAKRAALGQNSGHSPAIVLP